MGPVIGCITMAKTITTRYDVAEPLRTPAEIAAYLEACMDYLLFSCVNLARHAGIDAESALREANLKFEGRFNAIEVALEQQGRSIEQASLEEMDRLWEKAKQVMI